MKTQCMLLLSLLLSLVFAFNFTKLLFVCRQGAHVKPQKEITSEIQAIMRQITASVTFLPLLEETCSFDLLVYTDRGAEVPLTWEDSDPCIIANAEHVQLRSFSTKVHKVELKVSYRLDEPL